MAETSPMMAAFFRIGTTVGGSVPQIQWKYSDRQ
jgi:hypothetical protein